MAELCSLQYSIIINTFWADPHSDLLQNVLVKPKNMTAVTAIWLSRGVRARTTRDSIEVKTWRKCTVVLLERNLQALTIIDGI